MGFEASSYLKQVFQLLGAKLCSVTLHSGFGACLGDCSVRIARDGLFCSRLISARLFELRNLVLARNIAPRIVLWFLHRERTH